VRVGGGDGIVGWSWIWMAVGCVLVVWELLVFWLFYFPPFLLILSLCSVVGWYFGC
jgi:hypothetical protein